ncbi:unnamed protein product [Cuscuta campestris]|uniref:Uncharacterized protein n=1 Tax=Cuscuta campestris TaxID=132261 RepID=A0A484KM75_9ASTE|nr:unnamed protein product [Cuscuta campestris]
MSTPNESSPVTLDDIMQAITTLSNDLHATKLRVAELTTSKQPRMEDRPRQPGWRPPPSRTTPPAFDPAPRMRVDAPRFSGMINDGAVQVLLDGGSTHNFIHPDVAERLALSLHPVSPFRVYVGNGDSLRCTYSCPQTPLSLQGHCFNVDLYLLEIHGQDVVLGVQWLQTLGKVAHDYSQMTMEFSWKGGTVTLRGDQPHPRPLSYSQFCTLVATAGAGEVFELLLSDAQPPSSTTGDIVFPGDLPEPICLVLEHHTAVFGLPPGYAAIAAPLTDLLKKDGFVWGPAADDAFARLKLAMTTAPVLHLPDFSLPFYVETDASSTGIGAVLMQRGHPLAFFSKKLGPKRQAASTYHKELYAIVEAIQKWRQYLLGREFIIRTNQRSLKELLSQVVQTPEQQLYVRKLMGFKFRIEYKTGATNKAADALSRQTDEDDAAGFFMALAQPVPHLLRDLQRENETLPDLLALHREVTRRVASAEFSVHNGLLYYKTRLYISPTSPLRDILLTEFHATPTSGHQGAERTFRRIAQTEVLNRSLEQYLRAFTSERPRQWSRFLPWAELALNCSHHEGLRASPFQALYGRPPPSVFPTLSVRAKAAEVETLLRERAELLADLRANLIKMQQRMRSQANQHRRDVSFAVGDLVLLKLRPYRQHSVARPLSSKLARRYYGPFEVLERIDAVAYRLRLLEGCRIHDVFHVSLLKPFVARDGSTPTATLPADFFKGQPVSFPVVAISSRTVLVDGELQEQWLVRWTDGTDADATWEPVKDLVQHYPDLRLEDKVALESGGVDTGLDDQGIEHGDNEVPRRPRRLI